MGLSQVTPHYDCIIKFRVYFEHCLSETWIFTTSMCALCHVNIYLLLLCVHYVMLIEIGGSL